MRLVYSDTHTPHRDSFVPHINLNRRPSSVRRRHFPLSLFNPLLIILLGAAAHALVPLALADARLVVRRGRLDVLHDALHGAARLVAVAVH